MNDLYPALFDYILSTKFCGRRDINHFRLQSDGKKVSKQTGFKLFGDIYGRGDEVTMILRVTSCRNGILSFVVRNHFDIEIEDRVFQFDLKYQLYKMAVSLRKDCAVKLMKYEESEDKVQCQGCEKCLRLKRGNEGHVWHLASQMMGKYYGNDNVCISKR